MMVLLFVSVGIMVQAQQSAFQGTWIGEDHRSRDRLEISGNNWSHFYNNVIQAGGTARFSAGKAQLLLANGEIYFDLTLLAPGLIQQPITMWDGLYRFRLNQQNTPSQNSTPSRQSTNTLITENIVIDGIGQLTYSLSNSLDEIQDAIFIRSGRRVNLSNANWSLNTSSLSQNVKTVMNRHNVNYSMTISGNSIVVNKRDGNQWYIFWP
jgi:hypothetical protein